MKLSPVLKPGPNPKSLLQRTFSKSVKRESGTMWHTRSLTCLTVLRRSAEGFAGHGSRCFSASTTVNKPQLTHTTTSGLHWPLRAASHACASRDPRHCLLSGGGVRISRSGLGDCSWGRGLSTSATHHQEKQDNDSAKVKVLYDGHCPLCVKEIRLLIWANKRKQTMEFVDISQADYNPGQHGDITYDQAMEVMHVIGKDGVIHTRIAAMQAMYAAVGWGWLWSFVNLPLIGPLCDRAYDWFARNRLRLTGRDCETGTCRVKTKDGKSSQ